jgi:hypothetical protein
MNTKTQETFSVLQKKKKESKNEFQKTPSKTLVVSMMKTSITSQSKHREEGKLAFLQAAKFLQAAVIFRST